MASDGTKTHENRGQHGPQCPYEVAQGVPHGGAGRGDRGAGGYGPAGGGVRTRGLAAMCPGGAWLCVGGGYGRPVVEALHWWVPISVT